jgi:hypothetical protein
MSKDDLPWGWEPVTGGAGQLEFDLFSKPRDELLAIAGVSLDELDRWRAKGWVSFDARSLDELAEPLFQEVIFIRNLARSGLSDEQIGQLLAKLKPPYRCDPTRTAYSFAYGWVQPPPLLEGREVDEFVRLHFHRWVDDRVSAGDVDTLRKLLADLFGAVGRARAVSDKESENE